MNLLPFKHRHYKELISLLSANECPWLGTVNYKTLPKIGYLAEVNGTMVAAGFLRKVEGGYGQLDTFVTNPYLGSQVRHEGIELVTNALLEEARTLEMIGILITSRDTGIISRAKERGFFQMTEILLGIQFHK
jgi:hypothetical protein